MAARRTLPASALGMEEASLSTADQNLPSTLDPGSTNVPAFSCRSTSWLPVFHFIASSERISPANAAARCTFFRAERAASSSSSAFGASTGTLLADADLPRLFWYCAAADSKLASRASVALFSATARWVALLSDFAFSSRAASSVRMSFTATPQDVRSCARSLASRAAIILSSCIAFFSCARSALGSDTLSTPKALAMPTRLPGIVLPVIACCCSPGIWERTLARRREAASS
mmetsp:Transcript_49658/g.72903  ORF Transcript_49658/g.72903 Transcript_49658/m.72903 type:complete len:232 (-) Transcript_49658:1066-1761(-)